MLVPMSVPKGFFGPKARGKHMTFIKSYIPFLRALQREDWLSSFRAGIIDGSAGNGERFITVELQDSVSFRLKLKGDGAVQNVFIKTNMPFDTDTITLRIANLLHERKFTNIGVRARKIVRA